MVFRGAGVAAMVVACCASLGFAQQQDKGSDVQVAIAAIDEVATDKAIVGELLTAMVESGVISEEDAGIAAALRCHVSGYMAGVFEHYYGYAGAFGLADCLPPIEDSVGRVCLGRARCKSPAMHADCLAAADGMYCYRNQMAMASYLACVFGEDWQQPQISSSGWVLHTQDLVALACTGIDMGVIWDSVISEFRGGNIDACECELMNRALESEIQREIARRNCLQCPVMNLTPGGGGISIN